MFNNRQSPLFRNLTLLGTLFIIVIAAGTYFFWPKGTLSDTSTNTTTSGASEPGRVFIKDLSEYVDAKTQKSVEQTLYYHLDVEKPELFTGTIVPSSYTKKTTPSKQTEKKFLINVEPVKLTYAVALIGSEDVYSVNIHCALQKEQMVPTNTCQDTREP